MRGRAVGVLQLAQLVALTTALHAPVIPLPASRASSISLANFAAAPHGTAVPAAAATPRRHRPPRLSAAAPSKPPSATVVIGSCLSLSIVSGSFYAWSMLLPSLQAALGVARAPLSAVFSLATVCFTAGTSLGALAVDKISPSKAILLIASVSAVGLLLAAAAAAGAARCRAWRSMAGAAFCAAFLCVIDLKVIDAAVGELSGGELQYRAQAGWPQ